MDTPKSDLAEHRFGDETVSGLNLGLAIFTVRLWDGDSTSLGLSFLISKMGDYNTSYLLVSSESPLSIPRK